MRDAEVADLDGDGSAGIAVATHDQGVVAVLRPGAGGGFDVVELDREPDTFVHEIEVGDLDGDGVLEVYATPSEPNRLDGTPQSGEVVRYVPAQGEGRVVVADLGDRHAKEILVDDVDGDGRDELYVSVEAHAEARAAGRSSSRSRSAATTPARDPDRRRRDRDASTTACAASSPPATSTATARRRWWRRRFKQRPLAAAPRRGSRRPAWDVDADRRRLRRLRARRRSLTDLDGDGVDELYVASDDQGEVRRYVWKDGKWEKRRDPHPQAGGVRLHLEPDAGAGRVSLRLEASGPRGPVVTRRGAG